MSDLIPPKMSSVLGQTAVVVGNVRGTGDLEVRGRVQGSVELDGRLLVAESGTILGGVEAVLITVAGEVRGDLIAEDGVVILASGRVEGNIAAPRVGIEAGARVRGNLRTGDELPSRAQAPSAVEAPANKQAPASKSNVAEPAAPAQITPPRAPQVGTTELEDALDELLRGGRDDEDPDELTSKDSFSEKGERPNKRRRRRKGGMSSGEPRPVEPRNVPRPEQELSAKPTTPRPQKEHQAKGPERQRPTLQVTPGAPARVVSDVAATPSAQPDLKKARPARPVGAPKVPTFAKGTKGKHKES